MAYFVVSSVDYAAIAQWAASTAYTVGQIVRQLAAPTVGNERCFRCSVAGTSGASEPTWVLTASGSTVSGTATFIECTGQSAYQSAGNWTAAAPHIDIAQARCSTSGLLADAIYVADNHVETWAASRTWSSINKILVVAVAGSTLPPNSAAISRGAQVSTTGATDITFGRNTYIYGVDFSIGSGSTQAGIYFTVSATGNSSYVFENCTIKFNNTHASSGFTVGTTSVNSKLVLDNTTLEFGAAGQGISFNAASGPHQFSWMNTPLNGIKGTSPTALIKSSGGIINIEAVDLSGLTGAIQTVGTGANYFVGAVSVVGCKLNAATVMAANHSLGHRLGDKLEMDWSDTVAGASFHRILRGLEAGVLVSDNSVYRTGGAKQVNVPFSWWITSRDTVSRPPTARSHPVTPWIHLWNESLAAVTLTIEALANKVALPTDTMIWTEVEYMAQSDTPMMTRERSNPSPITPASPVSLTATTSAWGAGLTARTNSQVVAFGAIRGEASNPDRVFFCTVAGTTAASLPAGYATAIDGGMIVDGTATFRAAWRVKTAQTVTPAKVGYMALRLHFMDAQVAGAVTDLYVDPLLVVT